MSLYEQHQAALAELEAAKRRCRNPALAGGIADFATLQAFINNELRESGAPLNAPPWLGY